MLTLARYNGLKTISYYKTQANNVKRIVSFIYFHNFSFHTFLVRAMLVDLYVPHLDIPYYPPSDPKRILNTW